MWPYLFILFILSTGFVVHDLHPDDRANRGEREQRREFRATGLFWLLYIALILLAGLRFRIGLDTYILEEGFAIAPSSLWESLVPGKVAPGYGKELILYSLFKQFGCGSWGPQLLCAVMLNLPVACMIRRLTRRWFVASAAYIFFIWIPLNFEVMLFGAATGMLLWALPDMIPALRGPVPAHLASINRPSSGDSPSDSSSGFLHPWRFTLKILIGVFFHASILLMLWLPLLRHRSVRRWVGFDWRWWLTLAAGFIAVFFIRHILLDYNHLIGTPRWSQWVTVTSERIAAYEYLLVPADLNSFGYARTLTVRILLPAAAAWLLHRRYSTMKRAESMPSCGTAHTLTCILMIITLIECWALSMPILRRLAWFLWPLGSAGIALSLSGLSARGRILWWGYFILAAIWNLYSYRTPVPYLSDGHTAELYLPYSSQIERSYNLRREWIFFVYDQNYSHHVRPDTTVFIEELAEQGFTSDSRVVPSLIYDDWKSQANDD